MLCHPDENIPPPIAFISSDHGVVRSTLLKDESPQSGPQVKKWENVTFICRATANLSARFFFFFLFIIPFSSFMFDAPVATAALFYELIFSCFRILI